jgi:hypothetical protein
MKELKIIRKGRMPADFTVTRRRLTRNEDLITQFVNDGLVSEESINVEALPKIEETQGNLP